MASPVPNTSAQIGQRVGAARVALGRTTEWLAAQAKVPTPELLRIEAGQREPQARELARLAGALGLGVDLFLTESPPAIRSLRAERVEGPVVARVDLVLEGFARDVELLQTLGVLRTESREMRLSMPDMDGAERAAQTVRGWLNVGDGPLLELDRAVERLGVHTLCLNMGPEDPDGAYVALEHGGVVIVNGTQAAGRRRFTLAHEVGHHIFQDQYSTDWLASSAGKAERLINAFAVHLLLPREALVSRWHTLNRGDDPRGAMLTLAVEYRVSWSAVCAQCSRFELIGPGQYEELKGRTPTLADHMELGLRIVEELPSPSLSPAFTRAALAAHRKNLLGADRVIEMLRGTLGSDGLPPSDEIPLQAYASELDDP